MLRVHFSAEAGEVGVAHVIDENDDDVGFGGGKSEVREDEKC